MTTEDELNKEAGAKAKETPQDPELTPNEQEAQRKLFSMATIKELLAAIKKTGKEIQNDPRLKQIHDEQMNQLQMLGLALVEVVPGLQLSNDAAKIAAIAQKVAANGKKSGFFANLYSHVPPGLTTLFEGIDVLTPIPVAEIWQMAGDQLNIWKLQAGMAKDTYVKAAKNTFQIFKQPPQVVQATRQFKPPVA